MLQNTSATTVNHLLLNKILGCNISEQEFQKHQHKLQYLEPKLGKISAIQQGIYIVLNSKIRLTDKAGQLIKTVTIGEAYGHFTLFQEENLKTEAQNLNSLLVNTNPHENTTSNVSDKPIKKPTTEKNHKQKKPNQAYFPHPTQKVKHLLQRVTQRYPFFAQQSEADCGAACLVMISRYWGKTISINRLRDIANIDRSGASLHGLIAAAESIGFATRPTKTKIEYLAKQKLPAIIHWQGQHYIVVYEITNKLIIVGDPAIGQKTLNYKEFQENWTGYTLLLQPTVSFKNTQESTTPFWQFFELIKPHRLVLLEIFIASLLIQIFGLITPLFTQLIFDRVVVQRSALTLTTIGLGLMIFSLFRVAITGLREYLLVINNQLTIGQLVAFNMLLGNVISPFQRLSVLWNKLQEVIIALERINDVLDAEPEEDLQFNQCFKRKRTLSSALAARSSSRNQCHRKARYSPRETKVI